MKIEKVEDETNKVIPNERQISSKTCNGENQTDNLANIHSRNHFVQVNIIELNCSM